MFAAVQIIQDSRAIGLVRIRLAPSPAKPTVVVFDQIHGIIVLRDD